MLANDKKLTYCLVSRISHSKSVKCWSFCCKVWWCQTSSRSSDSCLDIRFLSSDNLGFFGILWESLWLCLAMSGYVWLCVQFAPSACRNQSRIETQHKEIQRAQLRMTEDDTSSSSSTFKTLCYIPFGIGKLQSWTLGVCMLPPVRLIPSTKRSFWRYKLAPQLASSLRMDWRQ